MDIQDSIDQRGYNQTENSLDLNNQGTGANPVDQESIDKQGNNHTENPVDLNNQGTGENSSNLVDPSEPETVVVIRSDETGENEESFRPSAKANKVLEEDEIEVKELKDDQKQHSCVIDVKYGGGGGGGERVCRICYLSSEQSPVTSGSGSGSGSSNTGKKGMELIELGCGCKDELGIVHSHCAETWFKLKGNKMCEICGETAKNITGIVGEERFMEEWNERNGSGANSSERSGGCWRGQPFCNFLTACLTDIASSVSYYTASNTISKLKNRNLRREKNSKVASLTTKAKLTVIDAIDFPLQVSHEIAVLSTGKFE